MGNISLCEMFYISSYNRC